MYNLYLHFKLINFFIQKITPSKLFNLHADIILISDLFYSLLDPVIWKSTVIRRFQFSADLKVYFKAQKRSVFIRLC